MELLLGGTGDCEGVECVHTQSNSHLTTLEAVLELPQTAAHTPEAKTRSLINKWLVVHYLINVVTS